MMGDAEPSQSGGVRRRHSGQHDEDGGEVRSARNNGAHIGTHTIDSHDLPQHVRFSTDVQRRPTLEKAKKRKSDEMLRDTDGADQQSRTPDVIVDTRASAIMCGGHVSGGPIVGSSTSVVSALESGTAARGTRMSPPPARSRNRGLSLRSALFARNFDRRAVSGDSIIEMQPVGSADSASGRPRTPKKGLQPSVAVSPVFETQPAPVVSSMVRPSSRKGPPVSALPHYQQWAESQACRHLPIKRIQDTYETVRKLVLRIQEVPRSKDGRQIDLDPSRKDPLIDERTSSPYIGNIIRSSKYTPFNFVPRQLFAQFSKLANFYFLIVATLQMIPGLSTTGTYTTIVRVITGCSRQTYD